VANPPTHSGPEIPGQFERCIAPTQRAVGPTRTVQLLATANYQGTAALVFVFSPEFAGRTSGSGGAAQPTVVAVSSTTCTLLVATSL
jgi:hypothetical protein